MLILSCLYVWPAAKHLITNIYTDRTFPGQKGVPLPSSWITQTLLQLWFRTLTPRARRWDWPLQKLPLDHIHHTLTTQPPPSFPLTTCLVQKRGCKCCAGLFYKTQTLWYMLWHLGWRDIHSKFSAQPHATWAPCVWWVSYEGHPSHMYICRKAAESVCKPQWIFWGFWASYSG